MIADIASGNTGAADILFLIAIILAFLAVLAHWHEKASPYFHILVAGAVGCIAFGLLLL